MLAKTTKCEINQVEKTPIFFQVHENTQRTAKDVKYSSDGQSEQINRGFNSFNVFFIKKSLAL